MRHFSFLLLRSVSLKWLDVWNVNGHFLVQWSKYHLTLLTQIWHFLINQKTGTVIFFVCLFPILLLWLINYDDYRPTDFFNTFRLIKIALWKMVTIANSKIDQNSIITKLSLYKTTLQKQNIIYTTYKINKTVTVF